MRVIDLSLSTMEVQELLLTELVQLECPELGVQHCVLIQDRQTLHDKLSQEEVTGQKSPSDVSCAMFILRAVCVILNA